MASSSSPSFFTLHWRRCDRVLGFWFSSLHESGLCRPPCLVFKLHSLHTQSHTTPCQPLLHQDAMSIALIALSYMGGNRERVFLETKGSEGLLTLWLLTIDFDATTHTDSNVNLYPSRVPYTPRSLFWSRSIGRKLVYYEGLVNSIILRRQPYPRPRQYVASSQYAMGDPNYYMLEWRKAHIWKGMLQVCRWKLYPEGASDNLLLLML